MKQRSNLTNLICSKLKHFLQQPTTGVNIFQTFYIPFQKIPAIFQFTLLGKGGKNSSLVTRKIFTVPTMEMLTKLNKLGSRFSLYF